MLFLVMIKKYIFDILYVSFLLFVIIINCFYLFGNGPLQDEMRFKLQMIIQACERVYGDICG